LDHVGESATRRGIRGQQLRQRLNCGAFVHDQNRPMDMLVTVSYYALT
jgi:hypothetical protein